METDQKLVRGTAEGSPYSLGKLIEWKRVIIFVIIKGDLSDFSLLVREIN